MSPSPRDDEPDDDVRPGEATDGALTPDATAPEGTDPSGPLDDPDAELAAWEAIVANYGERPRWDPPAATPAAPPAPPGPVRPSPDHPAGRGRRRHDHGSSDGGDDDSDLARGPEERYVPPPPPPLPRTTPARLLAWLGLLAVPVAVMVLAVAGVQLPMWSETLLVAWFVGGFSFLVATMRRDRDEPDDGAVL